VKLHAMASSCSFDLEVRRSMKVMKVLVGLGREFTGKPGVLFLKSPRAPIDQTACSSA
jgi:hypothetical protein